MCIPCHSHLTNEQVVLDLQNTLKNRKFDQWNTTSISHILLAGIGINGQEAKSLALQILHHFIEWRKTKPDKYIPEMGMEAMYSAEQLQEYLDFLKPFDPSSFNSRQEILDSVHDEMVKIQAKYPRQQELPPSEPKPKSQAHITAQFPFNSIHWKTMTWIVIGLPILTLWLWSASKK